MSIDKYLVSESQVYTPFDIQEGLHKSDENVGCTIRVETDLLPQPMKEDEGLVADAIYHYLNSFPRVSKPIWIVD